MAKSRAKHSTSAHHSPKPGKSRIRESSTVPQSTSEQTSNDLIRLFPGLSACLELLAKDLVDADAACKEQLEEDQRIPILNKESGSVVFVSVRVAILRSSDAPGDDTVAAANKIIKVYRDRAGATAICCFDKMLSIAQSAGSAHAVALRLAKAVRLHLTERWNPASVVQLLSHGGILTPALSPDGDDAQEYAEKQIRGPVLSRLDSHVASVLNDVTVEEAKAAAMAPAGLDHPELGHWADNMLQEGRVVNNLIRAGNRPESLRPRFPKFFSEVVDKLYEEKRDSFFEKTQRRKLTTLDLLDIIGDVKELSGRRLKDIRKQYRRDSGLTATHAIPQAPGTTRMRSRS